MAYICLLLSGAALLLNGLAALDRLPRRDAAVFSLVIGSTQLVLGVTYLGVTSAGVASTGDDGGPHLLLGASGMFLFGLTNAYVGLDSLLKTRFPGPRLVLRDGGRMRPPARRGLAWRGRHQTATRAISAAVVESPLPGELKL
jgi:AmiS/UreI family transporter